MRRWNSNKTAYTDGYFWYISPGSTWWVRFWYDGPEIDRVYWVHYDVMEQLTWDDVRALAECDDPNVLRMVWAEMKMRLYDRRDAEIQEIRRKAHKIIDKWRNNVGEQEVQDNQA